MSSCLFLTEESRYVVLAGKHTFALQHHSDVFRLGQDVSFRESNLSNACDIGERFTAVLQEDDGTLEAKPTLKETDLVHNIFSRVARPVSMGILGRHD